MSNALATAPDTLFIWLADSLGTEKLLGQHSESDFPPTFDRIDKHKPPFAIRLA